MKHLSFDELEQNDQAIDAYRSEINNEINKLQERIRELQDKDQTAAQEQERGRTIKRNIQVNILGIEESD